MSSQQRGLLGKSFAVLTLSSLLAGLSSLTFVHNFSVEFTPRHSAVVFKWASRIFFFKLYPCLALSLRTARCWKIWTRTESRLDQDHPSWIWGGCKHHQGEGTALIPQPELAAGAGWRMAAVMSSWILGLMIFQFTLWEVNRETCPWQGLFYRSFLTLTTTSGKALHCNSLMVALYSKHLVLQVKNYFWFFVLKLSFILGLNCGFGDFFLNFLFFF